MRLSSEIIFNHLEKHLSFSHYGNLSSDLVYDRPVLWTSLEKILDFNIYLCMPEHIHSLPSTLTHSILFTTQPDDRGTFSWQSVFVFENISDLFQSYNLLNELYALYEQWKEDLSNCLINENPLLDLIDCSQAVFENPILIHNRDFEFIAYSSFIKKQTALSYLVGAEESQEAYSSFRFSHEFQQTFSHHEIEFFPATITGIRSLYVNIFNDTVFIARIVVPEVVRGLTESDKNLLSVLADYIQAAITRRTPNDLNQKLFTLDNLIHEILEDKITEDANIENTLRIFHWQSNHFYFCTVFATDTLNQNSSTYKMVSNQLKTLIPHSSFVEYNQKLVMFTNLSLNNVSQAAILANINEFVRDNFLKVGYSRTYKGFHFSFQLLCRQAEIALYYGNRYYPQLWIHKFDEISDKYLMNCLINDLPPEMVSVPEVVLIDKYDRQHDTQYLQTLKIYLENNMHQVSTAKELFIHRTTLLYRLEKIQELFGLTLADPQKRMHVILSIKLLEMDA